MIAQALALHLPRPKEEIRVVHNPENPERPLVEVKREDEVQKEVLSRGSAEGELIRSEDGTGQCRREIGLPLQELRNIFFTNGPFLSEMREAKDG